MSEMRMDCCLDLMRRLPPQKCDQHLIGLLELAPDLNEGLLSTVDQPLKVAKDKSNGKEYLLCDYNRDFNSYRSPWTNTYDPPLEDGIVPSEKLRQLEIDINAAFDSYRELYFEGGISSAYLWDIENGFAGVILIKKESDGQRAVKGCWDSIHVVEVNEKSLKAQKNAKYKLVSTVMLWLETDKESTGVMNLGGSLSRQTEADCAVNEQTPHLVNIGRMIEDAESKMRSTLNEVYFGKAKQIVAGLRSIESASELRTREELVDDLKKAVTHKRPNNVKEEI